MGQRRAEVAAQDWIAFPGGELEGQRPKALCADCRDRLKRAAATRRRGVRGPDQPLRALCFQCYRADLERQRAMRAAGELNTASDARFQSQLPFEPVNRARLRVLKAA